MAVFQLFKSGMRGSPLLTVGAVWGIPLGLDCSHYVLEDHPASPCAWSALYPSRVLLTLARVPSWMSIWSGPGC